MRDVLYHVAMPPPTPDHRAVRRLRAQDLIPAASAASATCRSAPVLRKLRDELSAATEAWDQFSGGAVGLPRFQDAIARRSSTRPRPRQPEVAEIAAPSANSPAGCARTRSASPTPCRWTSPPHHAGARHPPDSTPARPRRDGQIAPLDRLRAHQRANASAPPIVGSDAQSRQVNRRLIRAEISDQPGQGVRAKPRRASSAPQPADILAAVRAPQAGRGRPVGDERRRRDAPRRDAAARIARPPPRCRHRHRTPSKNRPPPVGPSAWHRPCSTAPPTSNASCPGRRKAPAAENSIEAARQQKRRNRCPRRRPQRTTRTTSGCAPNSSSTSRACARTPPHRRPRTRNGRPARPSPSSTPAGSSPNRTRWPHRRPPPRACRRSHAPARRQRRRTRRRTAGDLPRRSRTSATHRRCSSPGWHPPPVGCSPPSRRSFHPLEGSGRMVGLRISAGRLGAWADPRRPRRVGGLPVDRRTAGDSSTRPPRLRVDRPAQGRHQHPQGRRALLPGHLPAAASTDGAPASKRRSPAQARPSPQLAGRWVAQSLFGAARLQPLPSGTGSSSRAPVSSPSRHPTSDLPSPAGREPARPMAPPLPPRRRRARGGFDLDKLPQVAERNSISISTVTWSGSPHVPIEPPPSRPPRLRPSERSSRRRPRPRADTVPEPVRRRDAGDRRRLLD